MSAPHSAFVYSNSDLEKVTETVCFVWNIRIVILTLSVSQAYPDKFFPEVIWFKPPVAKESPIPQVGKTIYCMEISLGGLEITKRENDKGYGSY